MIHAIRSAPGYESLPIYLKWPNDIYYISTHGVSLKLGGSLVQSNSTGQHDITMIIGIGLNLDNSEPTYCVNDLIREYNVRNNTRLQLWTAEKLLARFHVCFELLTHHFIRSPNGMSLFEKLYKAYWIHSNQVIDVSDENEQVHRKMQIRGMDERGRLVATPCDAGIFSKVLAMLRGRSETLYTIQPQSHSLDMTTGTIKAKISP
jgi:biotin---protein ligase